MVVEIGAGLGAAAVPPIRGRPSEGGGPQAGGVSGRGADIHREGEGGVRREARVPEHPEVPGEAARAGWGLAGDVQRGMRAAAGEGGPQLGCAAVVTSVWCATAVTLSSWRGPAAGGTSGSSTTAALAVAAVVGCPAHT